MTAVPFQPVPTALYDVSRAEQIAVMSLLIRHDATDLAPMLFHPPGPRRCEDCRGELSPSFQVGRVRCSACNRTKWADQ